jgi:hypothetical protein
MKCPHCGKGIDKDALLSGSTFIAGKADSEGLLGKKGLVLPHYVWVCPSCDKILAITPCDIKNEPTF